MYDGKFKVKFECLKYVLLALLFFSAQLTCFDRNPSIFTTRVITDDSTSNLNKHVKTCTPPTDASTGSMERFVNGCTYSKADFVLGLI